MNKTPARAALSVLLAAAMLSGTVGAAVAATVPPASVPVPASETATDVPSAQEDDPYSAYLFLHFVNEEGTSDDEQIYFSVSENGTDWTTLNNCKPVLKSNVGEKGVRDPHIIRLQDNEDGSSGGFAIVATDLSIYNRHGAWGEAQTGGSRNIVIWKSDTIDGWVDNGGTAYPIGVENALDVWAPESVWDKDAGKYMVFWASIVGDREKKEADHWMYRIYRSYTEDFVTFTKPEVYIEREYNIIDTTFYYNEADETYYRFTKNEGVNYVFMEKSQHIDGDFEMVSTYRLDNQRYYSLTGVEGPTVYKDNNDDKWYLLLDNWTYKPYKTDDITVGNFVTADEFTYNGLTGDQVKAQFDAKNPAPTTLKFRHGSVIPITKSEYKALLEKYPVGGVISENGDKTSGNLIYDLDFENSDLNATVGTTPTKLGDGDLTYVDGAAEGSKAVKLDGNKHLQLPSDIFKDKENLTVSFDVKIVGDATSWLLFAASSANEMHDPRRYYGVLWKDKGTISAERFMNQSQGDAPDPYDTMQGGKLWSNVTIVYYKNATKLFIDGKPASGRRMTSATATISAILGESPVVYIGKATWGTNGEFSDMLLDRFRVYDYAMPDVEVLKTFGTTILA